MASGSDVKAGGAYVEVFVKGFQATQRQLVSIGASVTKIGAGIAAVGTAIVGPLAAATKHFIDVGGPIDDMSGRLGIARTELAQLGYVADQTGSSLDDIEKAITRQRKNGSNKTFDQIAADIAAVKDPAERTRMALENWGRSGTMLLTMVDNLQELKAEARSLGIGTDEQDIKNADALGDAIAKIKSQFGAIVFNIGAALAPMLIEAAGVVSGLVKHVTKWVAENRGLVRTVALVGVSLVAIGTVVATAPVELLHTPQDTGEQMLAVVVQDRCQSAATTTDEPTTTPEPTCTGKCKWEASSGVWNLIDDLCNPTTTAEPTSSTAEPTTSDPCPCPTSTTEEPTTAAPPSCECVYPSFCPVMDGDCTYTWCATGTVNPPSDCPPTSTSTSTSTTTAEPTSSTEEPTTCDCNTSTSTPVPDGCSEGCCFVAIPTGGGWTWHQQSNGCSAICPCPFPETAAADCQVTYTACVSPPPTTAPPPPPECGGECRYLGWATSDCNGVELVSDWILLTDGCLDFPGVPCFCVRPSDPPTACGQVSVPCQSPTTTPAPTTTPDPGPCADCYTTTSTSTSSTTEGPTTTPDPCDGYCLFRSTGGEEPTWNKIADPCDADCPCAAPGLTPGADTCEIVQSPCGTETTTTEEPTTTSTTTSTSTSTTTTECPPNPECLGNDFACAIRCQNGEWEPILDHGRVCEGCCTCWGECATDPSGNCEPEPRVEGEPCSWPNGFLHGGFCFETATQFDAANVAFCVMECQSGNWVEIFNRTFSPCETCATPSVPCTGANEGERRFTCCECPTTTTEEPTTSTTSTTTEEPVGICCFQECIIGEEIIPRACQDLTQAECESTFICGQSGSWSEGSCADVPAPCAIWCNVAIEPAGSCLDPMDPRFCQDTYFSAGTNCGGPYYTQAECEDDCFGTTTEEPTTSTTTTSTTSTSTTSTSTSTTSTTTTSTTSTTTTTMPPGP